MPAMDWIVISEIDHQFVFRLADAVQKLKFPEGSV